MGVKRCNFINFRNGKGHRICQSEEVIRMKKSVSVLDQMEVFNQHIAPFPMRRAIFGQQAPDAHFRRWIELPALWVRRRMPSPRARMPECPYRGVCVVHAYAGFLFRRIVEYAAPIGLLPLNSTQ